MCVNRFRECQLLLFTFWKIPKSEETLSYLAILPVQTNTRVVKRGAKRAQTRFEQILLFEANAATRNTEPCKSAETTSPRHAIILTHCVPKRETTVDSQHEFDKRCLARVLNSLLYLSGNPTETPWREHDSCRQRSLATSTQKEHRITKECAAAEALNAFV